MMTLPGSRPDSQRKTGRVGQRGRAGVKIKTTKAMTPTPAAKSWRQRGRTQASWDGCTRNGSRSNG